MTSRVARHRIAATALCAVLAMVSVGSCGSDDSATTEPPTTTAPSTAPSTTLSPEEEDEQALRQLADDWFEAVRRILVGDADANTATAYISGEYLQAFRQQVADLHAANRSVRKDPDDRSSNQTDEVVVNGDSAELTECIVDGDYLIAADGEVLNDEVTARLVRTTATRTDAGWRFTARVGLTEEKGSDRCSDEVS